MKTTMKRIFSLLIVLVMVCGMLPVVASAAETTYTFSNYTAGTQYAENEEHVLDDDVTVVTTQCHFTTQLRIYSSSDHDGYAIINCTSAEKSFAGLTVNAGNKADTLNLYGSNDDGASWTLIGGVSTSTSYQDLAYEFGGNTYTSLKLDVAGTSQVRVASMTVTLAGGCSHTYTEEITTAATCTEDGEKTFTCSLCDDSYTEVIPATGHNYVDGVCASCGDTQFSISFSVNGTVSETIPYVSGGITMPAGNDNGSYTFAGWTDAAITTEGTVAPGTVYAAGQVVEFDAATTLYALYTRSEGSTATEYEKKALADIGIADQFVIVGTNATASYALTSANGSSSAPAVVTVTAADGKLSETPADALLWTLSKDGENYTFHPNGDTSKWLYCNSTNNGVRVGTGDAKTFVLDGSGYLKNVTQGRYLGIYNNQDWRCYTSSTATNIANQTFTFYAKPTATIYYTTTIGCNHDYEGEVTAAATCTEDGVMTYTCSACGDSYEELIPATGHSYDEGTVTTAATCTEDGVKTFACSCGDSYTEVIPATGHNYVLGDDGITYTCSNCGDSYVVFNIHFSVPAGEEAVADMTYVDGGITLPAVNVSKEGYTFAGWAAESVSNTDEAPALYAAGETFEATAETTLYAVYSYSVMEGNIAYCLLTDATSLNVGSKVILAANTVGFVATDMGSNAYMGNVEATFSADNTILESVPETAIVLTVGGSTGAWTLANSDGELLGATAVKKLAWGSGTTTWTITVADGVTTLTNTNASYGSMKYNSSSPRFTTYASGQVDIQLYVEKESATTYYTSSFVCIHEYDDGVVTTPATCSSTGVMTYTCALCGDSYTEEIPTIDHSYDEGTVTTEATCTTAGVMTYTCSVCGGTTTEEIPATGHDFSKGDCACGEADPIKTIPEANELGLAGTTTEKYTVEGTVTEIVNTTYGNMYIQDADGNTLYIYGMYNADGTVSYSAMETKPVVGDQIKVYGVLGSYNSVAQMKNAWLIHIHNYESVVTEATCESAGYTTHTCADCGKSYVTDETPFGHQLDEGTVTVEAACDSEGEMTYNCTACGAVVTEVIPMLPHTPNGEGYVTTDATCTTDGVLTYDACDVCGESYTEVIPATGHSYTDGQCTTCGYYEPDSLLTIPEANAFGLTYTSGTYTPDKFYVEGIIYNVYNPSYGNMYIRDAQGNEFTIYGLYNADGTVSYSAMDVKPVAGDYIKVYGNVGQYNGTAQIKNGWLAAHCTHKDAEGNSLYTGVETTAPDCENDGVMTYTCQCGHSYTEAIPAIGHNYVLGDDGVTYTCSNCGDSYSAFTVSFSVPEGITAVSDMTYTNGIVLPAAESSGDYIFIGWTNVELAAADKVETAPTIYPANETFYTNEACTLYALYAYDTVGGFSGYELADSADSLYDGAKIIIVGANYGYAMSTNQKTNNRGQAAVTIDADNRIAELADDVQVLTLQKDADTGLWALYTGEAGYLYAAASGSNYLRTQTTNDVNGLWEITFNSEKVASVVATGSSNRNVMQYNNSSSLFACYSSASQKALNIFVKQDGTVTYYSTDLGCNHEYVGVETTPAGCETEGVMTYTCGKCGESYTEVIEAIGHAWDEGTVTTESTCATAGVMTYTCANNGCTKEEAIARLTHDFTNGDCVCGHPAPESKLTIAEANQWGLAYDNDVYSSGKYYIEGTIESIASTTFGNMYIQDADGNKFYIYGLYSEDGSVRFDAMDPQPAVGDTIKIYTVIGTHDGKAAQAKNAWLVVDYVNSYNVELTDKIGMNFKLSADVTSATVTFGGETTTVDLTSLPTDENGLRIYNLKMAAVQMTEEVTWLFNGKTEVSYSVRGYADEVLAGEYGANVKAMVQAMLHYGAAAQDYFGYNEENLANADMTDDVTNAIQAAEMTPTTGITAGIVHYGSSLVYRDRVAVRVYFKLTGDAAIGDYTFTANGENAEVNEGSNGLYYVEVADIAPQNLDEAVTVVVNDGLTVTYSPLNYIYRMVNKTDDAALQTLLQQLYDYYLAADYLAANGADDFETEPDVVG